MTVMLMQSGTSVTPTINVAVNNVTSIVITRFGHTVVITLDSPRTVTLSPKSCTTYQNFQPVGQTLLIAMDHTAGASPSISYTVRPGT
ncbi:MAG: hypothetical protein IPK60_06440 [Sandaracinaceae bacterium]|nr:hypothetical protein [Sandaracinaceae bacterium]